MPSPVNIPLINPNETTVFLASLHVQEGQRISRGEPICTLETTKSTSELEAEKDGYIVGLQFHSGDTVQTGKILCYISEDPDWTPEDVRTRVGDIAGELSPEIPAWLRISKPALSYARQVGMDLNQLPSDRLVTETIVRSIVQNLDQEIEAARFENTLDPTAIIVYGGGGHGKSVIELVRAVGSFQIMGVIDDKLTPGQQILEVPILGGAEALDKLRSEGIKLAANAVGGIGDIQVRMDVFKKLTESGFACPTIIHPRAFVETSANFQPGVHVFPNAYVGSDVRLGYGCIINTGAIISHDCILGNYANIAPGAVLAGNVMVGARTLVGMGATINLQVKIGAGARIGNGSTVKEDVPENGIVRAGVVWP